MPPDRAADVVRGWYQARRLPAMIAIPYPAARPGAVALDQLLAERGWTVRAGAVTVMTARRDQVRAVPGPVPPVAVEVAAEPDEAWLARYHYRGQEGLPPVALRLLTSAPWQAFASLRAGGRAIAVGRVAAAAGWAGLTAIEVDPAHRRRGLASAVTHALTAEAGAHGARHLYLQVEDDNAAARALYRGIGFTDHHGYHYRVAPEARIV
jgi:ribosomal protein S18 acetylase RimI-like enzyme